MMAQDPGQVRAGFKHARSLTEFPHHLPGRVTLPLHYRHLRLDGAGLTAGGLLYGDPFGSTRTTVRVRLGRLRLAAKSAVTRALTLTGANYRVSPGSRPDLAQNAE